MHLSQRGIGAFNKFDSGSFCCLDVKLLEKEIQSSRLSSKLSQELFASVSASKIIRSVQTRTDVLAP